MNDTLHDVETTDSPVEHIATLEQEARHRREEALRQASQHDEPTAPIRPAITRLKKRRRGKLTTFFALAAILLLVLAWCSHWLYNALIPSGQEEETTTSHTPQTAPDYRQRTDLGQSLSPPVTTPPPIQASPTRPTSDTLAAPNLDKARFLVRRSQVSNTSGTTHTRQDEMASPPRSAPNKSDPATQSADQQVVQRIPYDPDLYIPENTAIPCSLDYHFVSDRAGKIRCTVTSDIWSASGHTKLIEKGTSATGVYQSGLDTGMKHGQGRAFIIITKLRTRQPPYLDIPLVDSAAAGALGEAGVDGWIDNHFGQRFGGALMMGMIPDIGAWATNNAGSKDRRTDYTENSRQAMAEMARTTLENSINIPPTLYKNQGDIINLITGQDIDFSSIYTLRMAHAR